MDREKMNMSYFQSDDNNELVNEIISHNSPNLYYIVTEAEKDRPEFLDDIMHTAAENGDKYYRKSAEGYTRSYVQALIEKGNVKEFREHIRYFDLLIIEFIEDCLKDGSSLEDLINDMETMRRSGKNIVVTSHLFPEKLNFSSRHRARLASGMVIMQSGKAVKKTGVAYCDASFENFLVTDDNKSAYEAAKAMLGIETDVKMLILQGDNTSGKSHLMHALYKEYALLNGEDSILSISGEKLIDTILDQIKIDIHASLANNKKPLSQARLDKNWEDEVFERIKRAFPNVKMLLVDDMGSPISGEYREMTRDAVFKLLKLFMKQGIPMVLTSDVAFESLTPYDFDDKITIIEMKRPTS